MVALYPKNRCFQEKTRRSPVKNARKKRLSLLSLPSFTHCIKGILIRKIANVDRMTYRHGFFLPHSIFGHYNINCRLRFLFSTRTTRKYKMHEKFLLANLRVVRLFVYFALKRARKKRRSLLSPLDDYHSISQSFLSPSPQDRMLCHRKENETSWT